MCVRVLTPYPEPDWNQGKRWSPLGQPQPLTLVKVRWLGQGRSPKGAAQVKPPNGLIKGDLVPGSCVSTHEVCECVQWSHGADATVAVSEGLVSGCRL